MLRLAGFKSLRPESLCPGGCILLVFRPAIVPSLVCESDQTLPNPCAAALFHQAVDTEHHYLWRFDPSFTNDPTLMVDSVRWSLVTPSPQNPGRSAFPLGIQRPDASIDHRQSMARGRGNFGTRQDRYCMWALLLILLLLWGELRGTHKLL